MKPPRQTFRSASLSLLLLTTVLTGSAAAAASPARKPARKPSTAKQGPKPKPTSKKTETKTVRLEDHPLIARLQQVESGPGILVCEPVPAADVTPDLSAFGAGCARWLHLVVGGQGELGRTPLWTAVDQARKELKRPDLRLSLVEAARLSQMIGITHVAIGSIKGNDALTTLSYQLYEIPSQKPVGEAVTVTGPAPIVASQLSALAQKLAMSLGVKSFAGPTGLTDTVKDLQAVGKTPWQPRRLSALDERALDEQVNWLITPASPGSRWTRPMAGPFSRMLIGGFVKNPQMVNDPAAALVAAMPGNTLLLAEVARWGYRASAPVLPLTRSSIDAALAKFPKNYLLLTASTYDLRAQGKLDAARGVAEQAVRSASHNPEAWSVLKGTIYQQSDVIRNGRTVDRMTESDWAKCEKFYSEQLPVALKAVTLDEACVVSWRDLSTAAAFLSLSDLADGAFGKAFLLDPTDPDTLRWGVELYQPKWLDDETKLRRVIDTAISSATKWTVNDRIDLAISLIHAGHAEDADKVTPLEHEKILVLRHFQGGARR